MMRRWAMVRRFGAARGASRVPALMDQTTLSLMDCGTGTLARKDGRCSTASL